MYAPFAQGLAHASFGVELGRRWRAQIFGGAGYVLAPVAGRADGQLAVQVGGAGLDLGLGLGYAP